MATQGATSPPASSGKGKSKAVQFIREVMVELRKTTWPTRAEVLTQTKLVISLVIFIGIFIYVVDKALAFVLDMLLALFGAGRG